MNIGFLGNLFFNFENMKQFWDFKFSIKKKMKDKISLIQFSIFQKHEKLHVPDLFFIFSKDREKK